MKLSTRKVKSFNCLICGTTTRDEGQMINHSAVCHPYAEPNYEERNLELEAKAVKHAPALSASGQSTENGVLQSWNR